MFFVLRGTGGGCSRIPGSPGPRSSPMGGNGDGPGHGGGEWRCGCELCGSWPWCGKPSGKANSAAGKLLRSRQLIEKELEKKRLQDEQCEVKGKLEQSNRESQEERDRMTSKPLEERRPSKKETRDLEDVGLWRSALRLSHHDSRPTCALFFSAGRFGSPPQERDQVLKLDHEKEARLKNQGDWQHQGPSVARNMSTQRDH